MKSNKYIYRKLTAIILILALFFSVGSVSVAASNNPTVYSANNTIMAGETIKVPVYIKNNSNILGWKLLFNYDSTVLTPTSVEYGNVISGGLQDNIEGDAEPGSFNVYWAGSEGESYNGLMFYVNFNVDDSAVGNTIIDIEYSQDDTFDNDFGDVVLTCQDVTLTIENTAYSSYIKSSLVAKDFVSEIVAGDSFLLSIANEGSYSLSSAAAYVINYDASNFTFKGFTNVSGSSVTINGYTNKNGVLTVPCSLSSSYSYLCFASNSTAKKNEYEFSLTISNSGIESVTCVPCTVNVVPSETSATAGISSDTNIAGYYGQLITIPVNISNNHGVMGYRINFSYDKSALQIVSATRNSAFPGNFDDSIGNIEGEFSVLWNNTAEIAKNGELFYLTFKVVSKTVADTTIDVSYSQTDTFNESYDNVVFNCSDVVVSLKGDVNPLIAVGNTVIDAANNYIYTDVLTTINLSYICTVASGFAVDITSAGKFLGTGSEISVHENTSSVFSYTLVVYYDVNGDGVCDALDAAQVALVNGGHKTLGGAYKLAADINDDDVIDVVDYQAIVNKVVSIPPHTHDYSAEWTKDFDAGTKTGTCSMCGNTVTEALEIDDILTFTPNSTSTGYVVSDCEALAAGEIVVPDTYNDLPVTSIGTDAFRDCTRITSIVVPDSVTSIGGSVFRNCTSLESLTLSDNITSIPGAMCYGCSKLESIIIPDGVTGIGGYAFGGCSSLKYVFYNGSKNEWAEVTIGGSNAPLTNAHIHYNSTDHTYEWTKYFEAGTKTGVCSVCGAEKTESLESVDWLTFKLNSESTGYVVSDCEALVAGEIVVPDTYNDLPVTSIGTDAFRDCTRITSIVVPDSVTSIGGSAFRNCTSLEFLTLSDNITSIPGAMCFGCTKLESIIVPDGVIGIGGFAFNGCTSLAEAVIPDSVVNISNYVFTGCDKLVIYCAQNSVVYTYAINNSISYVIS